MKALTKSLRNKLSTIAIATVLVTLAAVIPAAAGGQPPVTIAQLAGPWFVAFSSDGACGNGTHLLIFTLNSTGSADDFADTYNTTGCGQGQHSSQTFTIETLNSGGSGTATFSNNGNTLTFDIQVNAAKNIISLVDVKDVNQIWLGTAVRQ